MADFIPKPDCARLDGACFREGECLADCDRIAESLVRGSEVRQLREQLAAERAAREAAESRAVAFREATELYRESARLARESAAEFKAAKEQAEAALEALRGLPQKWRDASEEAARTRDIFQQGYAAGLETAADELRARVGGAEVDRAD